MAGVGVGVRVEAQRVERPARTANYNKAITCPSRRLLPGAAAGGILARRVFGALSVPSPILELPREVGNRISKDLCIFIKKMVTARGQHDIFILGS